MSDRNLRALRGRQAARTSRAHARLDSTEQPEQPTVEAIAEHVEFAGGLRHICLTVPRSRRPSAKRITLLPRSGPRSAEGKPITWDPKRRAVTAYWTVEDLRGWLESIGEGAGSPSMQIDTTPAAFEIEITARASGERKAINTIKVKVANLQHLGRVYGAIESAVANVSAELDEGQTESETADTKAASE